MTRCGTCWVVLKDGENVDDHAQASQLHAEAVQLLEDRREESRRSVRESLEGTEWGRQLEARQAKGGAGL